MVHIDDGDWQSLLQQQLAIVISAVIGDCCFGSHRGKLFQPLPAIVILAAISNRYFGGNRQSLFRQRWAIISQKLHSSHWRTVKTVVQMSSQIPFVFAKKTDKIWFAANGWPNITRNARWSAFAGPNEVFVLRYAFAYMFSSFVWTRPKGWQI